MNDRPMLEGGALRLRTHSIHIENRELVSITGVKDVGSFNENEVILMTDGGGLSVEGEGLHITKLNLDEGQIIIEGQLIALEYDEAPQQRPGFFSRMFR
ncbi:MAG: sporulation protein YabP [Clostridia bacterium]|nr:sporulation protein YabP [Clostridia bacterium]